MRRGVLKTHVLNQNLKGENSKARFAAVCDETGKWWSIYVATDSKTGKPRYNAQGDLIINVKPQKDFPQAELIDDPGPGPSDDAAVWQA